MPISRFSQVSRYRNAVLTTSKPQDRFTELGIGSVPDSGVGRVLAITAYSGHIFARTGSSTNSLLVLPQNAAKKYAKQPPLLNGVCQGTLGDFDVAKWQTNEDETILATGSLSGSISVRTVQLPKFDLSSEPANAVLPTQSSDEFTLPKNSNSSGGITSLQFHPNVTPLLASSSLQDSFVQLWDVKQAQNVSHWDAGTPNWDIKWNIDGTLLAGCGKDGIVRLWDARQSEENSATLIKSVHASKVKPIKCTFISQQTPNLILTTGFSQMREREVAIWDHRNTQRPLKRNTLDVASSGFEPICEFDRGIVYLLAKGDSSVRWIDVGSQDQGDSFAEGVFPLDFSAASGAIAPSSSNDVNVGEIASLFISTANTGSSSGGASASDAIIPSSIRVPRRNYIDFHSDLYPETVIRSGSNDGVISVDEWKSGKNATLEKSSMDPSLRGRTKARTDVVDKPVSNEKSTPSITQDVSNGRSTKTSEEAQPPSKASSKALESVERAKSIEDSPLPVPMRNVKIDDQKTKTESQSKRIVSQPTAEQAHWSRRPMAGSTPLISAYQNLSALDISRGPDTRMIAVSRQFFALPISGPGGRLGVHPIESHGRLPLHFPSFSHGTPLIDFTFDPFDDDQIISVASDGTVRLWKIPEPIKGENGLELSVERLQNEKPISSVILPGTGKVAELIPHPFVQGLVAVLPADAEGKLHLVDLTSSKIASSVDIPGQGLHSGSWSPDGSVLAVSSKNKKLYIIDPRRNAKESVDLVSVTAHDSPRSFRCVWVDGEYLLTVGHTIGSLRQLKLFRLGGFEGIEEIAKHNLDASPSVLFPWYDIDTKILYLWSKGERIISAYEIQPDAEAAAANVGTGGTGSSFTARAMAQQQQKDIFTQLPSFQHANPQLGLTFLPKDALNVREVEIASALRLSKSDIQKISWSVPRSRPEFFQDDIYLPTVIYGRQSLSIDTWLSGADVQQPLQRISLQPDDMIALSQAPPPQVKQSGLSKGPTIRQMTEKEKEDAMFNDIFDKAKTNDGEKDPNHNENQAARAPQNDDWDDDD